MSEERESFEGFLIDQINFAFDDFFRPLVRITPKVAYGQNDFKMSYAIEGKEFFRMYGDLLKE
jgi:hypothetical protein